MNSSDKGFAITMSAIMLFLAVVLTASHIREIRKYEQATEMYKHCINAQQGTVVNLKCGGIE